MVVAEENYKSPYEKPTDAVLAHYGVVGMKWGKRKGSKSSSKTSAPNGPVSADAATANKHSSTAKKHGTNALSNKELQEVVTRMNLEQQYSKLNGQTVAKGKGTAKKLLSDNAKTLAGQYVRKGMEYGIATAAAGAAAYAFEQKRKQAVPGLLAIEAPRKK